MRASNIPKKLWPLFEERSTLPFTYSAKIAFGFTLLTCTSPPSPPFISTPVFTVFPEKSTLKFPLSCAPATNIPEDSLASHE